MQKPESSVLARFLASAYAYVAGNAPQDVINAAEADAAQIQARIEGLESQIQTISAERDGFKTQVSTLQGQVTSLTTERDNITAEAAQLRTWKENHANVTGAIVPGADQTTTSEDIVAKFPQGSLMRQAIEAVVAKGKK